MTPFAHWLGSFVYVALLIAFVCTAIKEDDDRALLIKAGVFFGWIVVGTIAFCGVVFAIERWL